MSVLGEGSTFTVRLLGADAPDLDPGLAAAPRGAGLRLLHIEDSPEGAELVRRLAVKANWEVRTASTGEEGLELATADPPDAVLLDLHLPGARGEDVLDALRRDPTTSHVPVIMLSADATAESHERLTAAGAKAFLTKPVDVEELLEAVSAAVSPGGTEAYAS